MNRTRRVLRVFLASPSDLQAERKQARSAAERVNRIVNDLGWHVDLLGWEDRLPGYGRPQEQINEDVDRCDLMVGILWMRWGTPTGKHSSGFHEEFERARTRRRSTNAPELWLFFKGIDASRMSDPGEQLAQVLSFRKETTASNEVLYSEFSTTRKWGDRFFDDLLRYVLLLKERTVANGEQALLLEAASPSTAQVRQPGPSETGDMAGTFGALQMRLERSGIPSKGDTPAMLEILRASLFAGGWLHVNAKTETLGNHAQNLAFRHRDVFEPSPIEAYFLLKSMAAEGNLYAPGWCWLSRIVPKMEDLLEHLATDDNPTAKQLALSLLCGVVHRYNGLAEQGLLDRDARVQKASVRYISTHSLPTDVALLVDRFSGLSAAAQETAIEAIGQISQPPSTDWLNVLARYDGNLTAQAKRSLASTLAEYDMPALRGVLDHPNPKVVAFVVNELSTRSELSMAELERFAESANRGVRATSLMGMIALRSATLDADYIRKVLEGGDGGTEDVPFPVVRSAETTVVRSFLEKADSSYLAGLALDTLSVDGPDALEVLATREFGQRSEALRTDLADGFRGRVGSTFTRLLESVPEEVKQPLLSQFQGVEEFVRSNRCLAALRVLNQLGDDQDAKLARLYLDADEPSLVAEAARLLEVHGDGSDEEALFQTARRASGDAARLAARASLRVAREKKKRVVALLNEDAVLAEVGATGIAEVALTEDETIEFLRSESAGTRRAVAKFVALGADVETYLKRYLSGAYFYDVVVIFDRVLHLKRSDGVSLVSDGEMVDS